MSSSPRTLFLLFPLLVTCQGGDNMGDSSAPDASNSPAPDADPNAPDSGPIPDGCDFDDSISSGLLSETLQLQGSDSNACVILTRTNVCPPDFICKAVPFTLNSFLVGEGTTTELIDNQADLHWEESWHNWEDWGEAQSATIRYRLESRYIESFTDLYQLTAFNKDTGETVWGPLSMVPYAP